MKWKHANYLHTFYAILNKCNERRKHVQGIAKHHEKTKHCAKKDEYIYLLKVIHSVGQGHGFGGNVFP